MQRQAELKRQAEEEAALTLATPVEPSTESNGNSLGELRRLMADVKQPLFRRIDCAEVILGFEIAPGAAAGVEPEQIAAGSFRFLKAVIEAPGTPEALRFRCLKLVAAVENARAAAKSDAVTNEAKRRLLIALCNSERQLALRRAKRWNAVLNEQWWIGPADQIDWPPGWPGDWPFPSQSFATQLEHSCDPEALERTTAFRQWLRSAKAKNREDNWDRLLCDQPT
jgi:hypothetical protein